MTDAAQQRMFTEDSVALSNDAGAPKAGLVKQAEV